MFDDILRDSRTAGDTQCGYPGTCGYQEGIGMAVVAAVEFNYPVAPV